MSTNAMEPIRIPDELQRATAKPRRPIWLTILIILTLISAASAVYEFLYVNRPLGGAAFYPALTLAVSAVLVASAVGLWLMKKWGAILFVIGSLAGLIAWIALIAQAAPIYLVSPAFRCLVAGYLLVYGLIFRAFWRMAHDGRLS